MKQARVPTAAEMRRPLSAIVRDRPAERNRLADMLGQLVGLRVGENAALRIRHLADGEGRLGIRCRINRIKPRAVSAEQSF